ncbi:MAG TPA: hypothetical protein VIX41_07860, partial [Acidimicrobiales bacterium]
MHRRFALALALAVAVAVAVAGCGGRPSDTTEAGGTSSASPAAGAEFVGIEGVVGATDTELTLLTDPLPPVDAGGACQITATPRLEEHPSEIVVYVDYRGAARSPFDGCVPASRTVAVPLAAPVGDRVVADAMGARFWLRDGSWVGCGHVVMTCITTPASCENLRDFIANMDVPRHFGMDTVSCDGQRAVVDVDYGAGDCPVTGEPQANPCAGQNVRRLHLEVVDDAWVVVRGEEG